MAFSEVKEPHGYIQPSGLGIIAGMCPDCGGARIDKLTALTNDPNRKLSSLPEIWGSSGFPEHAAARSPVGINCKIKNRASHLVAALVVPKSLAMIAAHREYCSHKFRVKVDVIASQTTALAR